MWGLAPIACPLLVRLFSAGGMEHFFFATSAFVALTSFAAFLYIGVENALGGWLPSYAVRTNPAFHPSSMALGFWIAELTGPILDTILMTFICEAALYRLCLALLIFTQVLLCLTPDISAAGIGALMSLGALSLAPLCPLSRPSCSPVLGTAQTFGSLFAAASFGGASLPWLTGVFSAQCHALPTGLLVPAARAALLLVLSPKHAPSPSDKFQTV